MENQSVSLPVAKLLAIATNPKRGILSIAAVNARSAQGGSVILADGMMTYAPPFDFSGSDSLTYSLSDGTATDHGTVNVMVSPANQQSQNQLSITMIGSCAVVDFLGIPGASYVVQWAPTATGPWSDFSLAVKADATGLINYQDCTSPILPARFYRTRTGP